ncbi:MAG: hypothetical protein ABWX92_18260 [Mycetocola sp.]
MSSFDEKVAARAAARPTADVRVLLAADLVAERDRLQAIIDAPDSDPRLGVVSPADEARAALQELEDAAGDAVVTLRFTQLPGEKWTALTSLYPPRPNVAVDENYGYNFDTVTLAAARFVDPAGRVYGVRLEDGEEFPLSDAQWDALVDALSGHEVSAIRNTVWGLNEYMPEMQLKAMGKAYGATARSKKN